MSRFYAHCTAGVALLASPVLADVVFQPLTFLPATSASRAYAVSHDGHFVAGQSGDQAVRWAVAANLPEGLGFLPGHSAGLARGLSADGSVVVGQSGSSPASMRSFRWTAAGMIDLNTFNVGTYSTASAISADGQVIVGNAYNGIVGTPDTVAYRWTMATGAESLALTGGVGPIWGARGISADGSVIVGNHGVGLSLPFRWQGGSTSTLPIHPMTSFSSANAVSADAGVAVGIDSGQAVRWLGASSRQPLGFLPGTASSEAFAVSGDGDVVVGASDLSAFYWTSSHGMQDLRQVLLSLGASGLQGWSLTSANGISPDGLHIVGTGENPMGLTQAWIATIPAPGAGVVGLLAGALMFRRRR